MSIGNVAVFFAKTEDRFRGFWFLVHFSLTLWFVLACWFRPDAEKGSVKSLYAMVGGTPASLFQGAYLHAHVTGKRKPSEVATVACYVMPYVSWILFAAFGPSNILDNTAIGIYNWMFVAMTGVFTLQAAVRVVPLLCDHRPMQEYLTSEV